MQGGPHIREHRVHRGRRDQNKRRRDERCVQCEWLGIATKRRGWKVNLRQNLDEKNEQQDAQQKYKTAAPLSHHVTEVRRGAKTVSMGPRTPARLCHTRKTIALPME